MVVQHDHCSHFLKIDGPFSSHQQIYTLVSAFLGVVTRNYYYKNCCLVQFVTINIKMWWHFLTNWIPAFWYPQDLWATVMETLLSKLKLIKVGGKFSNHWWLHLAQKHWTETEYHLGQVQGCNIFIAEEENLQHKLGWIYEPAGTMGQELKTGTVLGKSGHMISLWNDICHLRIKFVGSAKDIYRAHRNTNHRSRKMVQ
jgi:hypothetical protein